MSHNARRAAAGFPELTAEQRDEYENNLVAAGALLAVLFGAGFDTLKTVEPVVDADGNVTNQIEISVSFLKSPYLITVERVTDDKH